MVATLAFALTNGGDLPSPLDLDGDSVLEASAMRALDLCARDRLAMVVHADDPWLVASSAGELQRTLRLVESWAASHKACFHVTSDKTVVMSSRGATMPSQPIVMRPDPDGQPVELQHVSLHRWLGVLWPRDLVFCAALNEAIALADHAMAPLSGLCSSGAIPLTLALELFESKVDGVLNKGRWLYTLAPMAKPRLDNALEHWARLLLGADWWCNGAVCRSELGWTLSGMARGVKCVALRRARLHNLPASDWYLSYFNACKSLSCGWAAASEQLLSAWQVQDWNVFRETGRSYDAYKASLFAQLGNACLEEWGASASGHGAQIPYNVFQPRPSIAMHRIRTMELCWGRQLMVRSWCRIRAGLVCHRHLDGQRSRAKFQHCIYCDARIRNAMKHTLAVCPRWEAMRAPLLSGLSVMSPDAFSSSILGLQPGEVLFENMLRFCQALDTAAHDFWANKL